jgi:hypothetical protein
LDSGRYFSWGLAAFKFTLVKPRLFDAIVVMPVAFKNAYSEARFHVLNPDNFSDYV